MKRIQKISFILLATVVSVLFFNDTKAEAATSAWKTISSGCKVRLVTDASTYSTSATSVDVYAESSGCPTFYYKMSVDDPSGYKGPIQTGSFSSRTPVKVFKISTLRVSKGKNLAEPHIDLYSNSSFTTHKGAAWGPTITIYR